MGHFINMTFNDCSGKWSTSWQYSRSLNGGTCRLSHSHLLLFLCFSNHFYISKRFVWFSIFSCWSVSTWWSWTMQPCWWYSTLKLSPPSPPALYTLLTCIRQLRSPGPWRQISITLMTRCNITNDHDLLWVVVMAAHTYYYENYVIILMKITLVSSLVMVKACQKQIKQLCCRQQHCADISAKHYLQFSSSVFSV